MMSVFYLVFFLTMLLAVLLPARTDGEWRWKLFITFLPLFLFAALRVDFGNDYSSYEMFFNEAHLTEHFEYDENLRAEIGYQLLCYIMPSYRSVLVLNAFILCLALAVFIHRNIPRKYFWLAVLLIFLNPEKNIYGNLVGIRNGLVVTGFMLGSVFIQRRKIISFAILTALLSTFHTAALLFMPLAYLVGRNTVISKKEMMVWAAVIALLLSFSVTGLIDLASPVISEYFDRYETYIEEMTPHRGILLTASSLLLVVIIFILYHDKADTMTPERNSLVRLGLLFAVSAFLGSLAMRANYFFDMFFIGTVVVLYSETVRKVLGLVLVLLAIAMSLYSFWLWQTSVWVAGNPLYSVYTSIWGAW